MELCAQGLHVDPGSSELKDISRRAAVQKEAQQQRDSAEQRRQMLIRSPARSLAEAVLARGWQVGRPQFTIGQLLAACSPGSVLMGFHKSRLKG